MLEVRYFQIDDATGQDFGGLHFPDRVACFSVDQLRHAVSVGRRRGEKDRRPFVPHLQLPDDVGARTD